MLIDLPGVGIAGDVHARVTEKFIREKAKVVVLVVSVRGVTQADAELLRNSGFLNRLLHAADDPAADPVQLSAVVVRADDIADTRYAADRSRPKRQHFQEVCIDAARDARVQLRDHLREAWRTDETLSETKQGVLDRIIEELQVHPVSAVQYGRALADDDDDRPFIKDPEESNVPKLQRDLIETANVLNAERQKRLDKARSLFFSSLTTSLRVIREQWLSDSRAEEEAQALRSELEDFIEPIRKEFSRPTRRVPRFPARSSAVRDREAGAGSACVGAELYSQIPRAAFETHTGRRFGRQFAGAARTTGEADRSAK